MHQRQRFLAGFNHILCGKAPNSALTRVHEQLRKLGDSSLSELAGIFGDWVPAKLLLPKASKAHSRQRIFSLPVTFWAFLGQVLSPNTACQVPVRKVQGFCSEKNLEMPGSATTAYCKARARLALEDLDKIHDSVVDQLRGRVRVAQLWRGHQVRVLDGTGVTLADTSENQAEFPQPGEQRAGCGFPVMKLVACFCLASGTLLKWVETSLKSHESRILRQFSGFFEKDDVVLADRGFCSYANLAWLLGQGVHAVMRVHQKRKLDYQTDGQRLGAHDRLVVWNKPRVPATGWSPEDWANLPDELSLRVVRIIIGVKGFRTRQYDLVTTLHDTSVYRVEDLAVLYMRRWSVELYFRHIKTTMGMEALRCRTPAMVRKELRMFIVAYNLIRGLMQEAAELYLCDLDRISFKATVVTLKQFVPRIHEARKTPGKQRRILDEMLLLIAEEIVPLRPERSEPRAVKRRPKPFPRLTCHRSTYVVPPSRRKNLNPKSKKSSEAP